MWPHERAGALEAPHDDLEQVLGSRDGEATEAEVVDDQERHLLHGRQVLLAHAVQGRVGEFLEEHVRLAVGDLGALQDDGQPERLGEVALAGAGWSEEERILGSREEPAGRKLEDQRTVHLLVEVEVEVEVVEGLPLVAEAGALDPALDEAVAASEELVGHERAKEVQRREAAGLGLQDAQLQVLGHSGEPELAEGTVDLGQVHGLGGWEVSCVTYAWYSVS
jgi:hypothetical protein